MRTLMVIVFIVLLFSACERKQNVTVQQSGQSDGTSTQKDASNSWPRMAVGAFPHVPGGSLGQPRLFWNEMEEVTCHMLSIDGKDVGWLYAALKTPSALMLFKCEEIDDPSFTAFNTGGSVYGKTVFGFYELKEDDAWKLSPVSVPGHNFFSVAKPCGDLIAYWADEGDTWHAAIYDFENRTVLTKKRAGQFLLETDDPLYLPVPEWDKGCGAAVFGSHYYMKEPITLLLE